ncbi:MAG: diaminopimelate decarboxylase, partial [Clostridia bacterium]|nr:diaminopimelate decarboxylase [Clostridia bacterium]
MKLQGTMTINEGGHLCIGGCDTVNLVKKFGSPLYVMDEEHLRQLCREYYQSFILKYPYNQVLYA